MYDVNIKLKNIEVMAKNEKQTIAEQIRKFIKAKKQEKDIFVREEKSKLEEAIMKDLFGMMKQDVEKHLSQNLDCPESFSFAVGSADKLDSSCLHSFQTPLGDKYPEVLQKFVSFLMAREGFESKYSWSAKQELLVDVTLIS